MESNQLDCHFQKHFLFAEKRVGLASSLNDWSVLITKILAENLLGTATCLSETNNSRNAKLTMSTFQLIPAWNIQFTFEPRRSCPYSKSECFGSYSTGLIKLFQILLFNRKECSLFWLHGWQSLPSPMTFQTPTSSPFQIEKDEIDILICFVFSYNFDLVRNRFIRTDPSSAGFRFCSFALMPI